MRYLADDLQTALNATLRYCPVLGTETEGRLAAIMGTSPSISGRGVCRHRRCGGELINATGLRPDRNCVDGSMAGARFYPDWWHVE
jgi:hypothetical protein